MLAIEAPAGSVLDSFSIAVGVEMEVANFPEVLCRGGNFKGFFDVLLAVRAKRFVVKINFHFTTISLLHRETGGAHEEDGENNQ